MGITIHYRLRCLKEQQPDNIKALVCAAQRRSAALVRRRALAEIGPVTDVHCARVLGHVTVFEKSGHDVICHTVEAEQGWIFRVIPGADCESAFFGLCRYPARISVHGRWVSTGCIGWQWFSSCKTQFAHMHGPEHFIRCHRAVIDLVSIWHRLGCETKIEDEGNYWPNRNEADALRAAGFLECAIAGLAGAAKDATDEDAGKVRSPIFAHPKFEHIEAKGAAQLGDKLQEAGAIIKRLKKQP